MEEQERRGASQGPRAGDVQVAGAPLDPPPHARHASRSLGRRLGNWAPSLGPRWLAFNSRSYKVHSSVNRLNIREEVLGRGLSSLIEHTMCDAFRYGRSLRRTRVIRQNRSKEIIQLRTNLHASQTKLHLGSFLLIKKKPFFP